MLVAIPVWQGRVSPVFDVAGQFLLVELDGQHEVTRREEAVKETEPERRVRRLVDLEVGTLICGAISRPLELLLVAGRIEVIPQVCGDVEEILEGFRAGTLHDDRFMMPGCCGRRRRKRRRGCGRGPRDAD